MKRYFAEAEAELHEAAQFYESRQSGLGDSFIDEIEKAVQDIEQRPYRWPVSRGIVRRCLVPKFPYAVLYLIHHEEIIVVAIMHLSRAPGYWFNRLSSLFDD